MYQGGGNGAKAIKNIGVTGFYKANRQHTRLIR